MVSSKISASQCGRRSEVLPRLKICNTCQEQVFKRLIGNGGINSWQATRSIHDFRQSSKAGCCICSQTWTNLNPALRNLISNRSPDDTLNFHFAFQADVFFTSSSRILTIDLVYNRSPNSSNDGVEDEGLTPPKTVALYLFPSKGIIILSYGLLS